MQLVRNSGAGLHVADARLLQTSGLRFVEFFGLPGIGKTTTTNLLAERLRSCGCRLGDVGSTLGNGGPVARQIGRLRLVLPRLLDSSFRSLLRRIFHFVAASGQESFVDRARVTWSISTTAAYFLERRSRTSELVIVDQGLLQAIWSVLLKGKCKGTPEDWHGILTAVGVDDIMFLHLRGDAGVARRRLAKRGDRSSRMQRVSAERGPQLWSAADRACREIAGGLAGGMSAKEGAVRLVCVDADASTLPEEVAERALEAVLAACRDMYRIRDAASR